MAASSPTKTGITPQAALVLDYLTVRGEITPVIAHMTLGVASLTARIAELRKAGYKIDGEWKADHYHRRYMSYSMDKPAGEPEVDANNGPSPQAPAAKATG
jgi:hypothetical protein